MSNSISPNNPSYMENFSSNSNPVKTFWTTASNLLDQAEASTQTPPNFYSLLTAAVTTLQSSLPISSTLEPSFQNTLAVLSAFSDPKNTILPYGSSCPPPTTLLQSVFQQLASNANNTTSIALVDQGTVVSNLNGQFTNRQAQFTPSALNAYPATGHQISGFLYDDLLSAGTQLVNASPPFTEDDCINNPVLFPIMQLSSLQIGMSADYQTYSISSPSGNLQKDFAAVITNLFNPSRWNPVNVFQNEITNIITEMNNPNDSLGYSAMIESMQTSLYTLSAPDTQDQNMSNILGNAVSLLSGISNNTIQLPSSVVTQILNMVINYSASYLNNNLKGHITLPSPFSPLAVPTSALNASTICNTAFTNITNNYSNAANNPPNLKAIFQELFANMLTVSPDHFNTFLTDNFGPLPSVNTPPNFLAPNFQSTWGNCLLGYILEQSSLPEYPSTTTLQNNYNAIDSLMNLPEYQTGRPAIRT